MTARLDRQGTQTNWHQMDAVGQPLGIFEFSVISDKTRAPISIKGETLDAAAVGENILSFQRHIFLRNADGENRPTKYVSFFASIEPSSRLYCTTMDSLFRFDRNLLEMRIRLIEMLCARLITHKASPATISVYQTHIQTLQDRLTVAITHLHDSSEKKSDLSHSFHPCAVVISQITNLFSMWIADKKEELAARKGMNPNYNDSKLRAVISKIQRDFSEKQILFDEVPFETLLKWRNKVTCQLGIDLLLQQGHHVLLNPRALTPPQKSLTLAQKTEFEAQKISLRLAISNSQELLKEIEGPIQSPVGVLPLLEVPESKPALRKSQSAPDLLVQSSTDTSELVSSLQGSEDAKAKMLRRRSLGAGLASSVTTSFALQVPAVPTSAPSVPIVLMVQGHDDQTASSIQGGEGELSSSESSRDDDELIATVRTFGQNLLRRVTSAPNLEALVKGFFRVNDLDGSDSPSPPHTPMITPNSMPSPHPTPPASPVPPPMTHSASGTPRRVRFGTVDSQTADED
jgi:hypothetical protein